MTATRLETSTSGLSDDELEAALVQGTAEQSAYLAWWLAVLAEFDRREVWQDAGMTSCAAWLMVKCGISGRTARDHIRTAHRLEGVPRVWTAFSEGRLSYSKVRALCRVARPDNEEFLLGLAMDMTASQLERHIAAYEISQRAPMTREQDLARRAICGVTTWTDDYGLVHHEVVTPPEEGLIINRAIEYGCAQLYRGRREADKQAKAEGRAPVEWPRLTAKQRRFEGLSWVCRRGLFNAERDALPVDDPFLIVLHVREGAASVDGNGNVDLGNGLAVSPPTLQRLCCSSMIQAMLQGKDDRPLDLGRRARTATQKQKIALSSMYETCEFPGCDIPIRWCQFHHLKYWGRDGGRSDLHNYRPLCQRHHTLVHEGGWELVIDHRSRVVAVCPTGRRFEPATSLTEEAVSQEALKARLETMGFDHHDSDRAEQIAGRWSGERLDRWAANEIAAAIWDACAEPGDTLVAERLVGADPPSLN